MVTKESEIHDAIKQRVVDAKEQDTTHILRSLRNTARVFKNKVALEVREREKHNADIKELIPLVSGTRGRKVYETGDEDAGVWTAGQTVGLIHDVPTCKELVTRIGQEAEDVIRQTAALISSQAKPHL
ncbi:nitronate monooxygenase [Malassezia pachydermatis]